MSSVSSGGRRLVRIGEGEGERGIVGHRRDRLHPGERLDAALRLLGLGGFGLPAVDEGLELLALGLLLLARGHLLRGALGLLPLERVIAADVQQRLAAIEVEDVIRPHC